MQGYKYNIGRVVGSKIRNNTVMPNDFTGWLNGDIFIHTDGQMIPYYEYINGKLVLLGHLRGQSGFTAQTNTGYFSLYVAQDDGVFKDLDSGETIVVDKGDIVVATNESSLFFELDANGNLYYGVRDTLKFINKEE